MELSNPELQAVAEAVDPVQAAAAADSTPTPEVAQDLAPPLLPETASEVQPAVAVIGEIIATESIPGADRIHLATVDCGEHGVWRGVTPIATEVAHKALVLLQDALLPQDNARWDFMVKSKWRVRMARFKGCPSECVILPAVDAELDAPVGTDVGAGLGVTKYSKPLPAEMAGKARGNFPSFIEKTDEPNFQRYRERDAVMAEHWYATIKYDGTSCTAFPADDVLHVCSRNLELEPGEGIYWQMAEKYNLQRLPAGVALQFEIIGPGIQGNPLGLATPEIRAFTLYDMVNRCKAPVSHLQGLCLELGLPLAEVVRTGFGPLTDEELRAMAEGQRYPNGRPAEGVVVRDLANAGSFKVLSLSYKD